GMYALSKSPTGPPVAQNTPSMPAPDISVDPIPSFVERVPPGGITRAELNVATITVGPWTPSSLPGVDHCPTGPVSFQEGALALTDGYYGENTVAYADVDHDGRIETLVTVECSATGGAVSPAQVIAISRDASGQLRPLGTITATTKDVQQIDAV